MTTTEPEVFAQLGATFRTALPELGADWAGAEIFLVGKTPIPEGASLWLPSLLLAPIFALAASLFPVLMAANADPAEVLRD